MRSATFLIGIVLAVAAFGAFLVFGTVLNPPPYEVVVATQDIPAYSTITADMLGVDAQTMNSTVARGLVTRDELAGYLGGLTLETIHAGEPLRKIVIATSDNPKAINRLAVALDSPDQVAVVVPVNPETAPEEIEAGDYVDIVMSVAPNTINANNQTNFGDSQLASNSQTPIGTRSTPTLLATSPLTTTLLDPDAMNLPVSKVTIQRVPILAVRRERIANPDFSVAPISTEGAQTTEPAFIAGDIQAVVVRVPRASVELLTFAIDNGKVHLSLLSPYLVKQDQDIPTLGMSWNDVIAWMMEERRRGNGEVVVVATNTVTPTVTIFPSPTPTQASIPNANSTPLPGVTPSLPLFTVPDVSNLSDLLSNISCILLPLGIGILLVIGSFVFLRRVRN